MTTTGPCTNEKNIVYKTLVPSSIISNGSLNIKHSIYSIYSNTYNTEVGNNAIFIRGENVVSHIIYSKLLCGVKNTACILTKRDLLYFTLCCKKLQESLNQLSPSSSSTMTLLLAAVSAAVADGKRL